MDTADLFIVPPVDDPSDVDLREVDIAIEMVARCGAVRVRLVGLNAPDRVAAVALARAQAAGVAFHIERVGDVTRFTLGAAR